MEKNEKDLITRAQKGDRSAFATLYRKYFEKIYRYCTFNTRTREDAQDIAQETFIKAWRGLGKFKITARGTFQAYLFQIARNLIIDLSRKKREVKVENLEEFESGEDLVEDITQKQQNARIKKMLDRLDEVERQIIILRYFEEMSYEEIAQATEMKPAALRVRIHRLLQKIAVIYEHEDRKRN